MISPFGQKLMSRRNTEKSIEKEENRNNFYRSKKICSFRIYLLSTYYIPGAGLSCRE